MALHRDRTCEHSIHPRRASHNRRALSKSKGRQFYHTGWHSTQASPTYAGNRQCLFSPFLYALQHDSRKRRPSPLRKFLSQYSRSSPFQHHSAPSLQIARESCSQRSSSRVTNLGAEHRRNRSLSCNENRGKLSKDQRNSHCSRESGPEERFTHHRRAIERILAMER